MSDIQIKFKRWSRYYIVISLLILAQVGWWATLFVQDVGTISNLRIENSELKAQLKLGSGPTIEEIKKQAFHRRLMFLSEVAFFAFMTGFALFYLYRVLKTEEKAQETQRNFIETLTHESKTPLTALKLRLESIRESWSGDFVLQNEISRSLDEVRRLISIVEKALYLNRLEHQKFQFDLVSISEVIRDVVRRMEPVLKERGVRLDLKLDEDSIVWGDFSGLQGTLQGLIENAVNYNDKPDKEISIKVWRDPARVYVLVEDNGPGIPETEQRLIFDKFYRGRSGKRSAGTGLGLYLAKRVIEAHKGVLNLLEGGVGTRFEIQIPVMS